MDMAVTKEAVFLEETLEIKYAAPTEARAKAHAAIAGMLKSAPAFDS